MNKMNKKEKEKANKIITKMKSQPFTDLVTALRKQSLQSLSNLFKSSRYGVEDQCLSEYTAADYLIIIP